MIRSILNFKTTLRNTFFQKNLYSVSKKSSVFCKEEYLNGILRRNGILNDKVKIFHNLNYSDIRNHEIANQEGVISKVGDKDVFAIDTGKYTGRSPSDRYIVKQLPSSWSVNWNNVNKPVAPEVFKNVQEQVTNHYSSDKVDKIYIFDGYCGYNADGSYKKKVRFITELAWQHHFVSNMFIRPTQKELEEDLRDPDFTVINSCKIPNKNWKEQGLNSDVFVGLNIEKKLGLITSTYYGGEMKKGLFTLMNYWLPLEGKLTLHSSACTYNNEKDSALFLSLSGGGKTTHISSDKFTIIGDDETIWDDEGLGNIEGGCYPKLEKLDPKKEKVIYDSLDKHALMENVHINEDKTPDFFNLKKTNNTRASYPIFNLDNYQKNGRGPHPKRIIYLAADFYGILPRVSILNNEQAMKYYLCGYTSNMPGTVRGENTIKPTFSCAFGNAFLPLAPYVYGNLLKQKIQKHGSKVYMVSTGLVGNPNDSKTERVPLEVTREVIKSIIDGDIDNAPTMVLDKLDGLTIPTKLRDIDDKYLIPWKSWNSENEYYENSKKLMDMFSKEFEKYTSVVN